MTNLPKRTRMKPTLVKIGNRQAISSGRWNHDVVAGYLMAHQQKWTKVDDLARLTRGFNSQSNRMFVRKRLPMLKKNMALHHNHLIVVEYAGRNGAATSVKLYDGNSATDRQAMALMLKRMEEQQDKMTGYYKRVTGLLLADRDIAA